MAQPGKEITRSTLQRALIGNALTKPVNVIVPAIVVVAGLVIGASWLVAVAAVVYVVLAAMTFFDEDEARAVGDRAYGRKRPGKGRAAIDPGRLAAPIAAQLSAALEAEARIRRAIDTADLPLEDLGTEVSGLLSELDKTAGRAQLVYDYLAAQNSNAVTARLGQLQDSGATDDLTKQTIAALTEQLDTQRKMKSQLERYYGEMEQTVAALNTIDAQIVQMSVASGDTADDEQQLTGRVRDLREQVNALTEGMGEAYAGGDTAK